MQLALLLAASSSADLPLSQRFRQDPNAALSVTELGIATSVIAALVLLWWLLAMWRQFRERRQYHSAEGLFAELCEAHQLSRRQRGALRALVQSQRLAQPALLFLRPDLFWPPHVPPHLAARQRELVELHGKLFRGANDAAPA
jgi:hypothetical protein